MDTTINGANSWDERTRALLGAEAYHRLESSRVLVVGVGGVGGYAAEMLVRSGIGSLCLIDADNVELSNLNRQLIATHRTIGKPKAILYAERFHSINPECVIDARCMYLDEQNVTEIISEDFDFVIDAIDTVSPKVALLRECLNRKVPVISSMGAGGRLDPSKVLLTDLWQTREDGLARTVRQRLKREGIRCKLPVVASTEAPHKNAIVEVADLHKRSSYGTVAAIPAMFGIIAAQYVINSLTKRVFAFNTL